MWLLAGTCGLQQHGASVDALRKRLVERFAEEVRSAWVRLASALQSATPFLHWNAVVPPRLSLEVQFPILHAGVMTRIGGVL